MFWFGRCCRDLSRTLGGYGISQWVGGATQIKIELSKNHVLQNLEWTVIARRYDQGDILLQIEDESRVAEVHLIWGNKPDTHPQFPSTVFYSSLKEWLKTQGTD
jgi:hypothetical protein